MRSLLRRPLRLALCALLFAAGSTLPIAVQGDADTMAPQFAALNELRQPASAEQASVQLPPAAGQDPDPTSSAEQQPVRIGQQGAGAEEAAWWERMAEGAGNCTAGSAGKARVLSSERSESADACAAACR